MWYRINGNRFQVEQVRLDATTMSGHHLVSESGLFQFGHSKDDPNLAQIKVMLASLDPLGMPLATKVVSGEQADDGLYLPILEQVSQNLGQSGLLWVGDCKKLRRLLPINSRLSKFNFFLVGEFM